MDMQGLRRDSTARRSPFASHLRVTATLFWREFTETALNFVFPPRCLGCARIGLECCAACHEAIAPVAIVQPESGPIAAYAAAGAFEGTLQTAVHALKYENRRSVAGLLAQWLYDALQRTAWQPTLFTAVPLHPTRFAERGYNQSALIGERLALRLGLPFEANAISRQRETRPQVGLNYSERQENVLDAFIAEPALVSKQHVIVIDDVYTTGATLKACAQALQAAGATTIWGLTVAVALKNSSP
jgi:ComF family protein